MLKKRLISATVGLMLLAIAAIWYNTVFSNVIFAVVAAIAMFETLRAFGLHKNILFDIVYISFVFFTVVFESDGNMYFSAMLAVFLLMIVCLLIFCKDKKYSARDAGAAFMIAVLISIGFNSMLYYGTITPYKGDHIFMLLMGLAFGWICDTFAYFTGRAFGTVKLCPDISPNKTVAGAVGGIVGTPLFVLGAFLAYTTIDSNSVFGGFLYDAKQVVFIAIASAVGAVIGIIGDLAFSYIKRECGIKDFGNIMPGHGGAMDRLDSVLFTSMFAAIIFDLYFRLFIVF